MGHRGETYNSEGSGLRELTRKFHIQEGVEYWKNENGTSLKTLGRSVNYAYRSSAKMRGKSFMSMTITPASSSSASISRSILPAGVIPPPEQQHFVRGCDRSPTIVTLTVQDLQSIKSCVRAFDKEDVVASIESGTAGGSDTEVALKSDNDNHRMFRYQLSQLGPTKCVILGFVDDWFAGQGFVEKLPPCGVEFIRFSRTTIVSDVDD